LAISVIAARLPGGGAPFRAQEPGGFLLPGFLEDVDVESAPNLKSIR